MFFFWNFQQKKKFTEAFQWQTIYEKILFMSDLTVSEIFEKIKNDSLTAIFEISSFFFSYTQFVAYFVSFFI